MLKPDYIARASERAEALASQIHNSIIDKVVKAIMQRLGRGDDYILTASDKYRIDALQDAGILLKDIQTELASKTPLLMEEIKDAFEDAGIEAMQYDKKIYKDAGIDTTDFTKSPAVMRAMERNYKATGADMENFTRTTASSAYKAFYNEMDKAISMVQGGAISLDEAVTDAIKNIAKQGIDCIEYDSGHTDTLEVAVARAVRTGISQATGQMQLARMQEMGVDLVITSSHLGARPSHELWQGGIYHVDFKTLDIYAQHGKDDEIATPQTTSDKYPDFVQSTRYGYIDGLCGVNCRHHFSPYFEGMKNPFKDFDSEENKKRYEIEQRQRELERRIRASKRTKQALQTAYDNCTDASMKERILKQIQGTSKRLAKQNKAYTDFCKENNLKPQEQRLKVLVERRQATKATFNAERKAEATAKVEAKPAKKAKRLDTTPVKVCDMPKDIYNQERFPKIKEFKATISEERINHYNTKENHLGMWDKYGKFISEIIQDPTAILKDKSSETAIVILKELDEENRLRVVIENEPKHNVATILTMFYVNKKNFRKYLNSDMVVYRKNN